MGNGGSQINNYENILDTILSQELFEQLIQDKSDRLKIHELVAKKNKEIKIYICQNDSNKNLYYVAHFTTIDLGLPSFGHLIWSPLVYHEHWVYGFNIYEYNKIDKSHTKIYLKKFHQCNINTRKGYNMSHDLQTNLDIIKNLKYSHILTKIEKKNKYK